MSNLLVDDPPIPRQNFVALSFLSPNNIKDKNSTFRALKVRGVFSTQEEACDYVKKLEKFDDGKMNIFVGEVGKWLPWDDENKVDNQQYMDKKLNDLMDAYNESQKKEKDSFNERVENMTGSKDISKEGFQEEFTTNNKSTKSSKKKKKQNKEKEKSQEDIDIEQLKRDLEKDEKKFKEFKDLLVD